MGSCQLIKEHGSRCGSTNGINPFYYKDGQNMWNGERDVCQIDSQMVFGKLLVEEQKIKVRIEKLQSLRKRIWNPDHEHSENIRELESEVTRALQEQNKLASVNSPMQRQKQVKEAMQNEVFRRIKRMGEILRDHRNKVCRLCGHNLDCGCKVCKHAENPRQWGESISSIIFSCQIILYLIHFHLVF